MNKINQQRTQINQTKEIVIRDRFKQNVIHENLHNIISECIYDNVDKRTKINIQTTTQKAVNRITGDLKNPLNTRINDFEKHTNYTKHTTTT